MLLPWWWVSRPFRASWIFVRPADIRVIRCERCPHSGRIGPARTQEKKCPCSCRPPPSSRRTTRNRRIIRGGSCRRALSGSVVDSCSFCSFRPPHAPKDEKKNTVEVSVVAILATERDNNIDPKLACIAQVRKTHKELTGFQMATMTRKSLSVGSKSIFEVVGAEGRRYRTAGGRREAPCGSEGLAARNGRNHLRYLLW